jgi:hypothetical protein
MVERKNPYFATAGSLRVNPGLLETQKNDPQKSL